MKAYSIDRRDLHVIGVGDLALLVTNDGELEAATADVVNVLDPATVALDGVGRETDELHTTLGELGLELGEGTKLSGADWSVVLGVREEDNPFVANELVEVDGTVGGLGIKVGGDAAQTERLGTVCDRHFVFKLVVMERKMYERCV